jgi:hypothetical protein
MKAVFYLINIRYWVSEVTNNRRIDVNTRGSRTDMTSLAGNLSVRLVTRESLALHRFWYTFIVKE